MIFDKNENYILYHGKMQEELQNFEPSSIDCIITDHPYELNFMGKGWDNSGVAFDKNTWAHCFNVLKDGGYLLAFGGSRTFHRIACAIEDAGFEIRDTIMWLYGSGFPKSMNVGTAIESKVLNGTGNKKDFKNLDGEKEQSGQWGLGKSTTEQGFRPKDYSEDGHERVVKVDYKTEQGKQWNGWGTALKPSYEPIIVARKPFKGSLVDNILSNGVGGLNIDECRVGTETTLSHNAPKGTFAGGEYDRGSDTSEYRENIGRFPANTILTYDDTDFEDVCGGFPNTKSTYNKDAKHESEIHRENADTLKYDYKERVDTSSYNDEGSASRYFYCAKAGKRDRDEGLDGFDEKTHEEINNRKCGSAGANREYGGGTNPFLSVSCPRKNTHPTVKPVSLMQYLVRLVAPKGATILDPFMGSGSTGKAVMFENKDRDANYKFIGVEMTDEYLPICKARIDFAVERKDDKPDDNGQIGLW